METLLSFEKVYKDYPSGPSIIHALKETNFEAKKGELIAIVGPSGSGKSTLLSLAGALLTPTGGTISINGKSVGNLSSKEQTALRLEEIGFIFQTAHLVPYLHVKDQISFIGKMAGKSAAELEKDTASLLSQLGISDRANFYPKDLSGGQKQRVAIARALINQPSVILADEPTASLDTERSREVVELIRNEVVQTSRTAIMVTHDERMLDLVNHVYRMEDGILTQES
ncbi:ABC transporter ATP-binding protein [Listeria marthii]|uniref:ABC transporter ATP-binding protein n=1 Tax=Listeria marthii TaxID=529731 RepID=UPI001888DD87|nr:ABC transporter ATP-binding protein [Listeria marthii]MBF2479600.1 ABC transporter ATP-binding protein [Listeria marthii]MBF2496211.1 ABC transporter ATP-binding protein [Listeria marthii]